MAKILMVIDMRHVSLWPITSRAPPHRAPPTRCTADPLVHHVWLQVSLWHITSRAWRHFDSTHYGHINRTMAEALARVYIINAASWIVAFYNRIRWWLPLNTQKKLVFLGGPASYLPVLSSVMDEETLRELTDLFEVEDGRMARKKES